MLCYLAFKNKFYYLNCMCVCVCVYSSAPLLMLSPLFIMPFSDMLSLAPSQPPHPISRSCDRSVVISPMYMNSNFSLVFPGGVYSSCHSCLVICAHDSLTFVLFLRVRIIYVCIWDAYIILGA